VSAATLTHGRVELAVHQLRDGEGPGLLHLHGLGERTPDGLPGYLEPWGGPVYGLDFTGHGASTVPRGGGYTAEVMMGDVDTVLRHLGPLTLFGRGLGAYVALLTAGARADLVRGAVLADGPGLVGGGIRPGSPFVIAATDAPPGPPDPYALAELSRDVRPPDYAITFVRHALEWSDLDTPLTVTTVVRPEWIEAIVGEPGVVEATIPEALQRYRE
jgi:pimeloyl-ACP methyl ester carboxylesterase